jgi:hypothetical protein
VPDVTDRMRRDFAEGVAPGLQASFLEAGARMAQNFIDMIIEERVGMSQEAFAEYEAGLVRFFARLAPEFGAWAQSCVLRARAKHEGKQ